MFDTKKSPGYRMWIPLAAVILWAAPVAAQGNRTCVRADLPAEFVLPDGSAHPPGVLRVCLMRQISPVQGIHATYVDGRPIGFYLSRFGRAEDPDPSEEAFFVFRRAGVSRLVLEAYAVQLAGHRRIYHLVPAAAEELEVDAPAGPPSPPGTAAAVRKDESIVLVSASR